MYTYPSIVPANMCYASNVVDAMCYCNKFGMDVSTCTYNDFGGEPHMGYKCVPPRDIPMCNYNCYYPCYPSYPNYLISHRRSHRRRSHKRSKRGRSRSSSRSSSSRGSESSSDNSQ